MNAWVAMVVTAALMVVGGAALILFACIAINADAEGLAAWRRDEPPMACQDG